jgi:hypothetical protein
MACDLGGYARENWAGIEIRSPRDDIGGKLARARERSAVDETEDFLVDLTSSTYSATSVTVPRFVFRRRKKDAVMYSGDCLEAEMRHGLSLGMFTHYRQFVA